VCSSDLRILDSIFDNDASTSKNIQMNADHPYAAHR